jgi:two-component system OmpR family sensor kinase
VLVGLAAEPDDAARAMGPAWPVTLVAAEPVEVVGDRARLRQVFDNLLNNVRAHTPPGTAATVTVGKDGDDALLSVSDDGPGMSEEQVGRAFERFYRADPSRSRLHGGAGLGLAIVAAIVETHGGTVSAVSTHGAGSTFTARLPMGREAEAVTPPAESQPEVSPNPPPPAAPAEQEAASEPEAEAAEVLPDPSRSAGSPPG